MGAVELLFLQELLHTLPQRQVRRSGERFQLDAEGGVGERVEGGELGPARGLPVERDQVPVLRRLAAVLDAIDVVAELLEERVQQTRMPPLVLRHGSAGNAGLELG